MRILIIGQPDRTENQRLAEEGQRLGHQTTNAAISELVFEMDSGFRVLLTKQEVRDSFDAIYIRGIFPNVAEALLLAELAHHNGLRVMDITLATENYIQSKTYQTWRLGQVGITMPHGFQTSDWEDARLRMSQMSWPLIFKGMHGSQGRHVHLCNDENQAKKLFTSHEPGFFLIQPQLDIKEEYRVLILGGRSLGAIRKTAPSGDFRANISLGGAAEAAELPEELTQLCERAARELGFEFSGVDLAVLADGTPIILEVNRSPGFSGFESATGVNVAQAVIKYLTD